VSPDKSLERILSGYSPQTRSLRSGGFISSRSAAELLLTQKTELPCHHDGLLRKTRHRRLS
jgi:hypothetical protein